MGHPVIPKVISGRYVRGSLFAHPSFHSGQATPSTCPKVDYKGYNRSNKKVNTKQRKAEKYKCMKCLFEFA